MGSHRGRDLRQKQLADLSGDLHRESLVALAVNLRSLRVAVTEQDLRGFKPVVATHGRCVSVTELVRRPVRHIRALSSVRDRVAVGIGCVLLRGRSLRGGGPLRVAVLRRLPVRSPPRVKLRDSQTRGEQVRGRVVGKEPLNKCLSFRPDGNYPRLPPPCVLVVDRAEQPDRSRRVDVAPPECGTLH